MSLTATLALTLLAIAPPNADADVAARVTERCRGELEIIHEQADFPGGSAAIILPDGTRLAFTVGVTDPEDGRPLTTTDRMLSGSIGKSYVTAMTLRLAASDLLDLDARAIDFFEDDPWFSRLAGADQFTVRHLLRHQSGLPRYILEPDFWETLTANADKVWKPEELLAFVFDREGLFAPGEGWAYSDTNYIIVGMIIEKIAQQSVYDYVNEHFLDPHHLDDTVPSNSRRIPGLIQGHTTMFRAFGLPDRVLVDGEFVINPQFEWCGGGYCNTTTDLARWAKILYSGHAFENDYLDEILDSVPADPRILGPNARYGPGCIIRQSTHGELRGHDGVMTGYTSSMGWFPDINVAVAIQINMDGNRRIGQPLWKVMERFAEIVLEESQRADSASPPLVPG